VFLIARTAQALARWDSAERRRKSARGVKLSQKKNPVREVTPNSSESSTKGQDRRVGLAGIASEQPTPD